MGGVEATKEDAALSQPKQIRQDLFLYISLPIIVITLSASLIRTNQYLMQEGHFPYPFVLVIGHCIFCSIFALLLLLCRPELFPALSDPDQKVELSMSYYTNAILPIALCFAVSLILSNMAYKYCTVAFLQMVKEGNIISIYVMAYFAGLEKFTITQVSASLCETAKTIFQALVLNGNGQKLDPLSTVLVVMPMSGLLLVGVLLFNNLVVDVGFVLQPSLQEIWDWRFFLALNILNAFGLNVAIAVFLKYLSAVIYILIGNLKDIVVVCMSAWIIHEAISIKQVIGFSIQICCVFAWSSFKQYGSLMPRAFFETLKGGGSKDS